MAQAPSRLSVEGTLTAASGELVTHLEADGRSIRWRVPDLDGALTRLPPLERSDVSRASQALAGTGLVLEVSDGTGALLEMGDIRPSPIGWVAFGSSRVRLHRLHRWARPLIQAARS
ncbi:MAG: hypothetical protein HKN74_11420 [Acidimicrobiia bacterium]|nr:hypothetical protein [Acidimicrobiia bacterium]MBT8216352.1 hypothetical protein [Acidimicrobiia bacterium]NNF10885.1 hypothetical protein [Acidimicrobiia bacterium]NNL70079.1 hypothetical protein [Acidimicrobiia bacterium]